MSQQNSPSQHDRDGHQDEHGDPNAGSTTHALSGGRALLLLAVLLAIAAVIAITGILPRIHARTKLADQTNALAAPAVLIAPPAQGQPQQEVVLPGNLQAYVDSPIYARTSGYLKKWYFDIGAHVKQGQLLADIESPEVDQQLAQAKADLATAEANSHNAQIQSARYQDLLKSDAVSRQDTDNFNTQAAAGSTTVKSALANVQRLQQMVDFEKVYAPFDGVVTARNTDIGQLINAGAGTTSGELFHLASEQTLRLFVNVPQTYSQDMKRGMTADLTFNERPGQKFTGKLVRTSNQIDPASRTLLAEFDVDNRNGQLFPGAYTQVHFKVNREAPSFIVPVSALMFRAEGLRVATVDNSNKVHLAPIIIGQDDGRTVQVVSGLDASSRVVQDPPDSLIDGETVHIAHPAPEQPAESGPQPGTGGSGSNQNGAKRPTARGGQKQ